MNQRTNDVRKRKDAVRLRAAQDGDIKSLLRKLEGQERYLDQCQRGRGRRARRAWASDICPGVHPTSRETGFIRLARSEKLHYAGPVASGGFPPHPLRVVPVAIQILVNEG
jgi:hypothetical protein